MRRAAALALTLGLPLARLAGAPFEAASIKPASPNLPGGRIGAAAGVGGPGTADPGRIFYRAVSLKSLLTVAYNASGFQIAGPAWLDTELFELTATMPPDSTQEQFREMLQTLLADRFQIKMHREMKEFTGYDLVVARKGPKMKESSKTPAIPETGAADPPFQLGPDGFLVPPQRPGMFLQMTGSGGIRSTFRQETMGNLANVLQSQLEHPVNDATGLPASYDFVLNFAAEGIDLGRGRIPVSPGDPEPQPDIFAALQSQLGLKLEPKKEVVEVIVIDRAEKTPRAN